MVIKAQIATVWFGSDLSIEGLMNENGEYGVAIPQLADLVKTSRNTASRDVKRLMSKDSKTSIKMVKWSTDFNKKGVNVLTIADFERVLFEYAMFGNELAASIVRTLVGLSLHQLFSDAFGVKFEAEDRQRWLTSRAWTKHDFRWLTDLLKQNGFTEDRQYAKFVWMFQTKLGIESGTRDALSIEKLVELQSAQVRLTTLMETGLQPYEALKRL